MCKDPTTANMILQYGIICGLAYNPHLIPQIDKISTNEETSRSFDR